MGQDPDWRAPHYLDSTVMQLYVRMCEINVAESYSKWLYGCFVPSSNETD